MAVFHTYSQENKAQMDVFIYDQIPDKLKIQVYHIWSDFFISLVYVNIYSALEYHGFFKNINKIICKEHALLDIKSSHRFAIPNEYSEINEYYLNLKDHRYIIDVISIMFNQIELIPEKLNTLGYPPDIISKSISDIITELNERFRQHGVGHEYINGKIIKVDSKLLHSEITKNTLLLISDEKYFTANEEFLKAHDHYKNQRYHECLNECLKAFESTMKIICGTKGWKYETTDTANKLINVLIENNFLKSYSESHLNALKSILVSGVPTIRNKNSGHGQGEEKIVITDNLASYMLYLTGATVNFLINESNV
jgi:hypothetical protein